MRDIMREKKEGKKPTNILININKNKMNIGEKIQCQIVGKDKEKPERTNTTQQTTTTDTTRGQTAEIQTDTEARAIGMVLDVVIKATDIKDYTEKAYNIKELIYEKIGDAYVGIKAYEWNYKENTVFATIEIQKALFQKVNIGEIETEYMKIHAIDEVSYSTPIALKRKIK